MTTYPTLDHKKDEIRLLSFVAPDDPGMSIRGTTATITLSAAVKRKFKALSYIPGKNFVDRRTLILNGERIWVSTQLDSALRLLAHHDRENIFVDVLCINQEDQAEKKHQANLVPRIFAEADEVSAWLGDSSKWTNAGLTFMQNWAKPGCDFDDEEQVLKLSKRVDLWKRQSWQQVEDLFYLPYWRGRWTLQELVLARRSFFLSGKKKIPFSDLEKAVKNWERLKQPRYAHIFNAKTFMINSAIVASGTLRLHSNLRPHRMKDGIWLSNNPMAGLREKLSLSKYSQDELYTLSRMRDPDKAIRGTEKSVQELLIDFAARVINDSDDLQILEMAGVSNLDPSDRFDIPSWAPTWDSSPLYLLPRIYNAGGNSNRICNWGEDEVLGEKNILRFFATGVKCGTVLEVDSAEVMVKNPAQVLGGEFAAYRVNEQYPTGIPIIQTIFRTMLLDKFPGIDKRIESGDPKFFDLAAGFLFMLQLMNQAKTEDLVEMAAKYELRVEGDGLLPDYVESFLKYRNQKAKNRSAQEILQPFLSSAKDTQNSVIWPEENKFQRGSANLHAFVGESAKWLKGRTMFSINKGYFGVGPLGTQSRDIVSVIWGCDTPVVLRKVDDHWVIIGPCFVLGLMDGEARKSFEAGERKERVFNFW